MTQEPEKTAFLPLLERICNLASDTFERQAFFEQLLDELIAILEIDTCWIHLFNHEQKELELVSCRGFTKQMTKELHALSLGQCLPGQVALLKEPLVSESICTRKEHFNHTDIERSAPCFIAAPMISRNNVFGVIGLGSHNPGNLATNELKLLSTICSTTAMALDREYLVDRKDKFERVEISSILRQEQELIDSLSHELQTPLTALIASAGLLIDELQRESKGPQLRLAHNIAHSASNLQNRLAELIDLTRTKTARISVKKKAFDFSALAHKVVDELSPLVNSKGLSLAVEMPDAISATADEQRMEQILLNLLSNAVKFTPQGGQVTLRARRDNENLTVEIQDTGYGVSEDEQAKLFQPYYRLSVDRHRLPGIGLGLAITKQLVELHRGRIWMKSKPGKGSSFYFSIPLSAK